MTTTADNTTEDTEGTGDSGASPRFAVAVRELGLADLLTRVRRTI